MELNKLNLNRRDKMELKIGDKVRFLNEKGGGIITALLSTSMVQVAIEEGFEVPVMVKDLIKIEPNGAADRFFDRPVNVNIKSTDQSAKNDQSGQKGYQRPQDQSVQDDLNQVNEPGPVTPLYRQSGAGLSEGIYVIFEPNDQKWLVTGNIDIVLVNNTSYDAIYSFLLEDRNNTFSGVNYDVILPYSKIPIETITREDLESWSSGIVQVLFYTQESQELLEPLNAHFKIKPAKFFKDTSYQEFKLTGSKAIVFNLGDLAAQKILTGSPMDKLNIDPASRQKIESITPSALIDKHRTGPREAEVDLHISALRTDYPTMPQNEILIYQLNYFSDMLESAIAYNYNRVVFIHGIGNGTLKSSIIRKLRDYENIELRKANFAQYGNGAVEIIIHSDNR